MTSADPATTTTPTNLLSSWFEEGCPKGGVVAFEHRANTLEGERFPDSMTVSSFAKFRESEKFKNPVIEISNQ